MIARRASIGRLQVAGLLSAGAVSCMLHAQEFPPLDPETLPAAGSDRAPGLLWPTPDLGDGPFLIESAAAELKVSVVARLQQPWSIAFLPDGDMLVTERAGRVRLIRDGVLEPGHLAAVAAVGAGGLMGLRGVALHPDVARNRVGALAFVRPTSGRQGEAVLARAAWTGTALAELEVIFEAGATDTQA